MNLSSEKSVAMLIVIMVIFTLTILSAVMLNLVSNQTRMVEHDISRLKAKYANEAAMVEVLELLRADTSPESHVFVSGRYDDLNENWSVVVKSGVVLIGDFADLTELNMTVDYSPQF